MLTFNQASTTIIEADVRTIWASLEFYSGTTLTGSIEAGEIQGVTLHTGACGEEVLPGSMFIPYMEGSLITQPTFTIENGQTVKVYCQVKEDPDDATPADTQLVGTFIVSEVTKARARTTTASPGMNFSAVGALSQYKDLSFQSLAEYPRTGAQVLTDLVTFIDDNSDYTVTAAFENEAQALATATIGTSLTGLTVGAALSYVAGLAGGFITEDEAGNLVIRPFKTATAGPYAIPADRSIDPPEYLEPYTVTGVKVIVTEDTVIDDDTPEEDPAEETGEETTEEEATPEMAETVIPGISYTYGDPVNVEIKNPYMTETIFNEVFVPNFVGLTYEPGTIKMAMGDPRLEPGDVMQATDISGGTHTFPVLQLTTAYTGGCRSEIYVPGESATAQEARTAGPLTQAVEEVTETAEQAENLAKNANKVATDHNQYFWHTAEGTDTGAHVTQTPQAQFIENPAGGNTLITSNGLAVRDGLTELATFTSSGVTIGEEGKQQTVIGSKKTTFQDENGNVIAEIAAGITTDYANVEASYESLDNPGVMITSSEDKVTETLIYDQKKPTTGSSIVISLIGQDFEHGGVLADNKTTFNLTYGTAGSGNVTVVCGTQGVTTTTTYTYDGDVTLQLWYPAEAEEDPAISYLTGWTATPAISVQGPRFIFGHQEEDAFNVTIAGNTGDDSINNGVYLHYGVPEGAIEQNATAMFTPGKLELVRNEQGGFSAIHSGSDGDINILSNTYSGSGYGASISMAATGYPTDGSEDAERTSMLMNSAGTATFDYASDEGAYGDMNSIVVNPKGLGTTTGPLVQTLNPRHTGSGLYAENDEYQLRFIIGNGGTNRGIYDQAGSFSGIGGWALHLDANNQGYLFGLPVRTPTYNSVPANIITANTTNATISNAYFTRWGGIGMLAMAWTNKSAITVPANGNLTNITIGTLKAGFCPRITCVATSAGDNAGTAWYSITSAGVITLNAMNPSPNNASRTIAAGTTFNLFATFVTI